MRWRTLLVLAAAFLALGLLWLRREREEAAGPEAAEHPLCPGLVPHTVKSVRVDHLERSFQMKLERDAAGRWFVTDPVSYPAQGALVQTLIAALASARAEPAPEAEPAQVGLEPPLVVVELVEADPAGDVRRRIELGRVDAIGSLVHARVPGHPSGDEVFRTTRMLVNTLERYPDDYRDRRATGLAPQDVVSVRRKGTAFIQEEGRRIDLAFDALLGPDGWKRVGLPAVSLDPQAMGLLIRGACELPIDRFVDDSPTDVAPYGLEPPELSIELQPLEGAPVELRFGRLPPRHGEGPEHELAIRELTWLCQRTGYPHVWEVRPRDVELLTRPASLFFDQLVVRALRDDIARLELEGGGSKRVLVREKRGWTVAEEDPASAALAAAPHPGDAEAIEAALALLERTQLPEHLEGEELEPVEPPLAFTLVLDDGTRQGGILGRPTRDPATGAQGRQFLRHGDEVVALIDEAVAELCARPLDAFRSRRLHRVQESQVRAVELAHAGTTFTFVNTGDNVWNPRGQRIEAPRAFVEALDGLLNLSVARWLDADPAPDPAEADLAVVLQLLSGERMAFAFSRRGDEVVCRVEGGPAAIVDGKPLERLLTLFQP